MKDGLGVCARLASERLSPVPAGIHQIQHSDRRKKRRSDEMQNRRDFYQERPHYIKPEDLESAGEISEFRKLFLSNNENVTFSLVYLDGPSPIRMDLTRYRELTNIQRDLRYFRCPPAVTIGHLKKLLKAKYELRGSNYRVDMFFREDALNDEYSLIDISYIFLWNAKDNISLTFKVYEAQIKRRRRRYFGGVEELPAYFTPLSILQSRLGILANSMAEDNIAEGRRHLRSDIERKKKEIEARIEEERRLSERELRSHDERRREKDNENKKNEAKKKYKYVEKKKDKKKSQEERKKKREGRCHDEKRKEKDDKEDREDKDDKRKDKDAKEERKPELEMRKAGEKRKWEGEPEVKRKRERREESNVEKEETKEVNEDGCEEAMNGEATFTTASEADSTQTSTTTQPPVSTLGSDSASGQAQTSTSAEEASATTSATETTSGSTSTSEPTSTTATENEQKAEEADVKANETPISTRNLRATPPRDSGDTEIQLQISESGVMSTTPVVESSADVIRTVEEVGCGRVTRLSAITAIPFRDEGLGNREMKKRGPNVKNDEGFPKDSRKPKTYKTIFRSANLWNPTISKENLRSNFAKNKEEPTRPPKFFKMRGRLRSAANPSSDGQAIPEDPAVREKKEEEELPQHEIEKEEAKVEPEAARVAIRDDAEAKRIEEDKRRFEEIKQKEEEKRKFEEDKMEMAPTFKADPKIYGPLDKDDKCSMIVGASAPDLPTNLKGDPKTFGPLDEDRCSVIVGASAPNLPTNLKGDPKSFGAFDNDDKCSTIVGANAPDLPTNLKGGLKTFGAVDKEDRCSVIVGASAPNLLTNPFIPNSNHFLFSDVTLPTDSGNFSKSAESKLDKSLLGKAVPGIGALEAAGLAVSSGIGSGSFQKPVPNGGSYSSMCFLDPSRYVYPYQTYPVTDTSSYLRGSHLSSFGNMGGYSPVTGYHASLPPSINNLSSPHQNTPVVSLRKNKDDSTKERFRSCDDGLNQIKFDDRDLRKRRRVAETEVTNFLNKGAPGKGTKLEVDEEEEEDDGKISVPAKRKRDEKGSRDKENKGDKEMEKVADEELD